MKRMISIMLAVAFIMLLSIAVYAGDDLSVQIIGADTTTTSTVGGDLQIGEKVEIEKVFDITLLGFVADKIAMSIPAYERPDDETVKTPETKDPSGSTWGNKNRYKYEKNGDTNPYADMYIAIGTALEPSSDDYLLLDIRLDILNKALTPLDLSEAVKATLVYDDDYEFEMTAVKTEKTDPEGNKNEWLTDELEIPVLVSKTVHVIFEVPEIVGTGTEPLVAKLTVADNEFEIVLR